MTDHDFVAGSLRDRQMDVRRAHTLDLQRYKKEREKKHTYIDT